jgi:ActR/RegA family two-component response regulator
MTKGTTVGLRPKSVLIVDDNRNVQLTLIEIITEEGFKAITASSRKEAIALSDRQAFEVAFVDKRLVEYNHKNEDGFAILRHISKKNEGTHLVLLTGYGEYEDAVLLSKDIGAFKPMKKDVETAKMEEEIREVLKGVAARPQSDFKKGLSARIFCGQDVPGNWETRATSLLKPAGGLLGLMNFLDEIAQTCSPLLERPGDNGIQKTDTETVMGGLYWSRGVGEAVIILLAKDKLPDKVPQLDTWPPNLFPGEVLYQAKRKNLFGAIIKCSGVSHIEFTVPRSEVE